MVKIPVRNKSKDNPYTLGYDEEKNVYTVEFSDNKNIIHKVEITDKIYGAFDSFELEDTSQIHKYSKYIEHSEIYEETLNKRAMDKQLSVEEIVEHKMDMDGLKLAIDKLTDIQKRRLKMYYFEDMTLNEIAEIEECSIKNVHKSIEQAKENIKKSLKN